MMSTAVSDDQQLLPGSSPRSRWPRRRRSVSWIIAVLVIAAIIGVPTWWQLTAHSIQPQQGSYTGDLGAYTFGAGPIREECFAVVPGTALKFGVSFENDSSHSIDLKSVEPPLPIIPTTITMIRINDRSTNPMGPEQPFAPLTLKQGDEVMLVLTMQVPSDVEFAPGTAYFDDLAMSYRTMDVSVEKRVPIGYWILLNRPNPGSQPCQPEHID